jgi:hypothetical protein
VVRQYRSAASDLPPPFLVSLNKSFNRAVVSPFHIGREVAGRQLAQPLVIDNTLAANAFSGTGLVGTVAFNLILLDFALPHVSSLNSPTFKLSGRTCDPIKAKRW